MYKPGEKVLYGNAGICEIKEIREMTLAGRQGEFYVMEPLQSDCTVYVPVDTEVYLRPVITREQAEKLIDMIPDMQAREYTGATPRELTEHYQAMMDTHDCADLIELTMSAYGKKQLMLQQKGKFGMIDTRFMKKAEELLYAEFSVALGMPKESVAEYIASRVAAMEQRE